MFVKLMSNVAKIIDLLKLRLYFTCDQKAKMLKRQVLSINCTDALPYTYIG